MCIVIFVLAFAIQGAILASSGLNPATWQYWAVTALTGVASVALAWRD